MDLSNLDLIRLQQFDCILGNWLDVNNPMIVDPASNDPYFISDLVLNIFGLNGYPASPQACINVLNRYKIGASAENVDKIERIQELLKNRSPITYGQHAIEDWLAQQEPSPLENQLLEWVDKEPHKDHAKQLANIILEYVKNGETDLSLSIEGFEVTSLPPINSYIHIYSLSITDCPLLETIENIDGLETLEISMTSDFLNVKLSNLPNLKTLNCTQCNLKIENLPSLEQANFTLCDIEGPGLQNHPKLESLLFDKSNCFVPLEQLEQLKSLHVEASVIANFENLFLPNLTELSCANLMETDEDPNPNLLQSLPIVPNLETLHLTGCFSFPENSFYGHNEHLPHLTTLKLTDNKFETLPSKERTPNLKKLFIIEEALENSVIDYPLLEELFLEGGYISSLELDLPTLKTLSLKDLDLTNLSNIHIPILKTLCFDQVYLKDLKGSFPSLKSLAIKNCESEEFQDLSGDFPNLSTLHVENSSLTSIPSPERLPCLTKLIIKNIPIQHLDSHERLQTLKIADIDEVQEVFSETYPMLEVVKFSGKSIKQYWDLLSEDPIEKDRKFPNLTHIQEI